jgi:ABC-type uncharacterized transport system permease subunit
VRRPRLRFERRLTPSRAVTFLTPPLSILAGLAVGSCFLLSVGASPAAAYRELLLGSFGSWSAFTGTLVKAIPLMICGLGASLAFRMSLWNIGAEGQLYLGAAAATWFTLLAPGAPAWLAIPSMMLLALAAGALWSSVAGALKAFLDINEIIVTLMLNYIAINIVDLLVYGPWRDPGTFGFPMTPVFGAGARLPILFGGRVHLGLLMAVIAALLIALLLGRTRLGFEMRVIGENPQAARYAGLNVRRTTLLVMAMSGALAGLAGMSEVAGLHHRLQPGFSPGYGFTAIIVAWLASLNPLAVLIVAVLFGGLLTGGDLIQITLRLPLSLVNILQGVILFAVLAGSFLKGWKVRLERGVGP